VRRLPYSDYRALLPHLRGVASWYGPTFHGKRTANGEVYNQFSLTAAHLRLPMGTRVMVENLENRARVWVRINDRGPYKKKRVIDLSRAAAVRLGMIKKGTAPVRIAVVRWPDDMDPKKGLKAYGQFVVQVAAYPDALKAEGERRNLKSRFDKVQFRLRHTPKGLYSIYAGPFDDEPAARRIASALRKGGVHSLVRSYRK
jgi:rare lipoprotein A